MQRLTIFRFAAACCVLAALLMSAAPTSAFVFRGTMLVARFGPDAAAGQGLVAIDGVDTSRPRVHGTFVGLLPYLDQNVVFRSIDCTGTPAASNRILRIQRTANAIGEVVYDAVTASHEYNHVLSVWASASGATTCAPVVHGVRVATGDVNGDNVLGLVKTGPGTLTLLGSVRPGAQTELTIVVAGLSGDDAIQIRATSSACGSAAPSTSTVFQDTVPAGMKTGDVAIAADQLLSIRALRIRNTGTGFTRCAPAIIMANTEGDFH